MAIIRITMSYFANIKELPPDPLFGLKARYNADSRPNKVDLGIGAYRDNNGKPWILPAVRQAEKKLQELPNYDHEYLGITGYAPFVQNAAKVILGADSPALANGNVVSQQTLSGTGALHVAGVFLYRNLTSGPGSKRLYLLKPTWANHHQIFTDIGFQVDLYPYWKEDKTLDFDGFVDTIKTAPRGLIFVLHACAHNPTGLDPTKEQWQVLLTAIFDNGHVPLFDSAYQGFALGSLDQDAYLIRYAVANQRAEPIVICQSFAKNAGMYGERVGCVHVISKDTKITKAIATQLNKIVRSEVSLAPGYGSKVVATILTDPQLYEQWKQDLVTMSSRIHLMRVKLRDSLKALGTPGNWDHIVNQVGMFSFTGLSAEQVARLEKNHAVYLVSLGRALIAGLNDGNVERVAQAIDEVVRHVKTKL